MKGDGVISQAPKVIGHLSFHKLVSEAATFDFNRRLSRRRGSVAAPVYAGA